VKPTEVAITKLDVTLDSPEAATVDMIVRVSGNVVGEGTPGTVLVGLRVSLVKKGETWLVTDAEVQEPVRAGR
jgi:propanediol utilization protein